MGTIRPTISMVADLHAGAYSGGATVQVYPGQREPSGYIVAVPGYTRRIGLADVDAYHEWVEWVSPVLAWGVLTYAGCWVDGDEVVLDVVEDQPERAVAEALGRARGEIAIWDVKRGEEITLLTGQEADARRLADVS